jgi:HSP20 family protein
MIEHAQRGVFGDWWPALSGPLRGAGTRVADFFSPEADAAAAVDYYEITIDLPGVNLDEIDVSVHDQALTVKGEKKGERESKGKSYFFSERVYGAFQRSFRLPADADTAKISSEFKDGVLTIKVAKLSGTTETTRRIEVRKV